MSGHKVGGEVDGWCTKCKMILAHTILAMVGERIARVKCNTCGGEHVHHAGAPGEARPSASATTTRTPTAKKLTRSGTSTRTKAQAVSFDDKIAGKNPVAAKKYAVGTKFEEGDLVDHPNFGLGLVESARHDKVDVTFRSFVKTLLHNRSGGPAAKPTFSRPGAPRPVEPAEAEAAAEAPAAEGEA